MKSRMIFVLFMLIGTYAHADLLDRMNLEEGFRNRIREIVKVFDPQAQVLMQFSYNGYQGTLPGTSLQYDSNVIPTNIEKRDLAKIEVRIYSNKNSFPKEVNDLIYGTLPIEKSKIHIQYQEMKAIPIIEKNNTISAENLDQTLQKVVKDLGYLFATILLGALSIGVLVMLVVNFRRNKQFASEVDRIVESLKDLQWIGGGGNVNAAASSAVSHRDVGEDSRFLSGSGAVSFSVYNLSSLKAMISDCYWAEKDEYASWIWKKMDFNQRSELLGTLPYIEAYSRYLSEVPAVPFPYFDHAYYVKPFEMSMTSQEDLAKFTRATPVVWNLISPLRQSCLPLRLEEKIDCLKSSSGVALENPVFPVSVPRDLFVMGSWGDLSVEDEVSLLKNPQVVPVAMRGQIKSLVWLSLLPEEEIRSKLEQVDAKSLASAWVGPEEMLERLESLLPDRKKELLRNYRQRIPAQRDSDSFVWLWEESLKHAP
ncbi:MAG: hypothetical protein ACM3MG_13390 [Bacillota bacterium]